MNKETITVVCDDCASGLANDDWSWLDYAPDDDVNASVAAFCERGMWISATGTVEGNARELEIAAQGYYQCPCCGHDAIGGRAFGCII